MIDRLENAARWSAGECAACGEPMPSNRAEHREFCGSACRQRAYRARIRKAQQAK